MLLKLQLLVSDNFSEVYACYSDPYYISDILDGVLERHKLLSTTTHPPSPTRQAISSPAHSSPKPGTAYQTQRNECSKEAINLIFW